MRNDAQTVFAPDAFDADTRKAFGHTASCHKHSLAEDPMFTDEGLASLLDRYPREAIGVYSMGDTAGSWRNGTLGDITGAELVEAVKAGKLWLNLRASNKKDAYLDEMNEQIFGELKRAMPGFMPFCKDLGLLISSPGAKVFYHLDVPRVMLFHVRGHKRVWVYPREEPFVHAKDLEAVVAEKTEEEIPYEAALDEGAQVFDLNPGEMLHWPQNGPHRIENGNDLNVSLSIEFMTPLALMRANAVLTNAWLRDKFGYEGGLEARPSLGWLPKAAFARVLRVIEPRHTKPEIIPKTFVVNAGYTA
ncbi:hypothetical protein V0U79_09215 [Hyphobacterium sp. HN65]|uniref:JmjC domain-containing protein n=1 Tax=Hyphobacterium lacteum TaxID=3116575 RepID=A0ABU7LRN6_9PROT|nr:hypothetical protein [Hyphobacterium sp. HN65]MEE2526545.1 hypothetical protein [Hyphobacterium sp. HN65]